MGRAIAATLSDITCLVNQQEKSIIINYEMTTIVTIPNENNMITSYINKHIRRGYTMDRCSWKVGLVRSYLGYCCVTMPHW